jgi:hypothetical protein
MGIMRWRCMMMGRERGNTRPEEAPVATIVLARVVILRVE